MARHSALEGKRLPSPTLVRPFLAGLIRKAMSVALGAFLFASVAAEPTLANQYPPTCADSITIWNVRNPAAPCHPLGGDDIGDTIWVGLTGVVTAVDTKRSGVGFWMQLPDGGPYSGVLVFTANTIWPVQVGDGVVVRPSGMYDNSFYKNLVALEGTWGDNLQVVVAATGLPLPPTHEGTAADFEHSLTNTALMPWEGCLVRCTGPLRVAQMLGTAGFVAVDDVGCSGETCDSVYVDCIIIPNPSLPLPAAGTILQSVQGVLRFMSTGYRILLRSSADLTTPVRQETWGQIKVRYR